MQPESMVVRTKSIAIDNLKDFFMVNLLLGPDTNRHGNAYSLSHKTGLFVT